MSKAKSAELKAQLKNLREQQKRLKEEKKKEQEERKRIREEKKLQKLELQLKKMDENGRVDRQKEKVILCVEARPCLWDKSCSDYKDKYAKEIGWKEVARELDLDPQKVKNMWTNLTDQAREIWRNEVYHSGDGVDDKIEESKTWKFYKSLDFYRKMYKFRKTESNFKVGGGTSLSDSEDDEVLNDSHFDRDQYGDSSRMSFSDDNEDQGFLESQHANAQSQSPKSPSFENALFNSQAENNNSSPSSSPSHVSNTHTHNSQPSTSRTTNIRVAKSQKSKEQNKSSRASTVTQKPKVNKRKHDELDEKLLSHMELAAKVFTETEDPTDKFLSYLGENLRLVSQQKRRKCEQDILKLVNAYGDEEECQVKVVVTPASESQI